MNFPCPLDAFDDIARLIMVTFFLSCLGAVWLGSRLKLQD
jgi:hypothetical protein